MHRLRLDIDSHLTSSQDCLYLRAVHRHIVVEVLSEELKLLPAYALAVALAYQRKDLCFCFHYLYSVVLCYLITCNSFCLQGLDSTANPMKSMINPLLMIGHSIIALAFANNYFHRNYRSCKRY